MLDLTTFDAALKQHYTSERVENMVYRDNPFFALVPKYESFGGKNLPIPLIYGNPQGRSKTFSNAQARGALTSSLVQDFVITRAKDYSIATIDNETLEASKGDANAFIEAATTEIDGAIHTLTRSLSVNLFRDQSSYIGQVSAEPSTNASTFVVAFKDPEDVTNAEVGQMVVIYSAKTGGTQRISETGDDEWAVAAVDRSAGTITLTGTYDANGTIAANDYIFIEGDRGNGMAGLEAWIPTSAPDSTSFFGVDRSVDVTRLGGLRLDASSLPIEEALIEADHRACREGARLDHFFMTHKKFGELKKALGSKVEYIDLKPGTNASFSFRGVMIDGSKGPIKVVPDQNCQNTQAYGVTLSSWKLYSLGKAVRVIDTDGLNMLRQATADGVEVRYGSYSQLGCRAPGWNINVTLGS
jgi:hypothetical protein